MKKIISLCVLLAQPLICMDDDDNDTVVNETPTEQRDKLQLNYANKKITAAQFAKHIQESPNLIAYNAEGHVMQKLPDTLPTLFLQKIKLNNGSLNDPTTLPMLLTKCPHLKFCSLAHNQLETLCEASIPYHENLLSLDCNTNQIKFIDFTRLREQLPNLMNLNASHNALTNCNTEKMPYAHIPITINLCGNQHLDAVKKDILKNARCVSKLYTSPAIDTYEGSITTLCTTLFVGSTAGTMLGLLASMPLGLKVSINFFIAGTIGGAVVGSAASYFGSIYCKKAEDREVDLYIPQFDATPAHTEKEITTGYQRFIRHFPYIGNIKSCCKKNTKGAENPESTPLVEVTE